jgi:sulfonate transport system ATP-binding protein
LRGDSLNSGGAGDTNEGTTSMHVDSSEHIVSVRGLCRAFGNRTVLRDLDLSIEPGEFVALLGPSGCGKSTFLRVLAGLDPNTSGHVSVPARKSVVFQEPRLLPWKRVWKNVALGLECGAKQSQTRALQALDEVGLAARADAWPLTLSGGEAQRVALARALAREPELLLLDEPFGALDALTRIRMHALLAELWARHKPAVLLVTHDVDEAILLADRAIVLAQAGGTRPDTGSAIVADLSIELSHPRRRRDPRFGELRRLLLGYLGVEDDDGESVESSGVRLQPTPAEQVQRPLTGADSTASI